MPAALDGVDTVFLLGVMSPDQTAHELAVVDAAEAAGVRRVVKLSVWRADEGLTPIAHLHRPVEQRLRASSLGWTLLRPNFYMQNFSRQMGASIGAGVLAQPATDAAISVVDTRDIAEVAAAVLVDESYDERILALTGPEALTYSQAACIFSTVLGCPVRYLGPRLVTAGHVSNPAAVIWTPGRGRRGFCLGASRAAERSETVSGLPGAGLSSRRPPGVSG